MSFSSQEDSTHTSPVIVTMENGEKIENNYDSSTRMADVLTLETANFSSVLSNDLLEYDTLYIGGPLATIQEVESMPSLSPPELSPLSSTSSKSNDTLSFPSKSSSTVSTQYFNESLASQTENNLLVDKIPQANSNDIAVSSLNISSQNIVSENSETTSLPQETIKCIVQTNSESEVLTKPQNGISHIPSSIESNQQSQPTMTHIHNGFHQNDGRVWVEHPTLGYAPGTVLKTLSDGKVLVSVDSDSSESIIMKLQQQYVPVHPSCLQGVPDLLELGEFDLGPLLHNIRVRYFKNEIYTSIGLPILISVNPYKAIPKLYSSQTAAKYRQLGQHGAFQTELSPHPFLIAQIALSNMFSGLSDQSIIISGESGAGKTEATKIILSYLAGGEDGIDARALGRELGHRSTERLHDQHMTIETQITRSNPVLESFGNAKTLRNDNSSRFGKFTQIFFDTATQRLVGARISNYLLEKSRIVRQQDDERNYHIFYQLCVGRESLDEEVQNKLCLDDPENFRYLNQCTQVPGRDDYEDFCEVRDCLKGLGLNVLQQNEIWSLLSAILHLGNVDFKSDDDSNDSDQVEIFNEWSFEKAAELLNVPKDQLSELLKTKSIRDAQTRLNIKKKRTLEEIFNARDALCKAIYEKLFQWIVGQVNIVLETAFDRNKKQSGGRKSPYKHCKNHSSIGLLDIFGFEVFDINSFEQLCINFANEQLQQHFNLHMFREEQGLYVDEGIDWSQIKFEDNKKILDALVNKVTGVFPTLDSECLMPKATDGTFLRKMISLGDKCNIILKPPSLKQSEQFGISHYAGAVFYDAYGMLDKNRDRVHQDVFDTFDGDGTRLLQEIFSDFSNCGHPLSTTPRQHQTASISPTPATRRTYSSGYSAARGFANATVSFTFREQLTELMNVLGMTTASYIRCIKPNSKKAELTFESIDILRQLKCAGMLESIRIRKAGYPIRFDHHQFLSRYKVLLSPTQAELYSKYSQTADSRNLKELSKALVTSIVERCRPIPTDGSPSWQAGKTKIFLKERLQTEAEHLAAVAWGHFATVITKNWRRYTLRRAYYQSLLATHKLQAHAKIRCYQSRFQSHLQPRLLAAIKVQSVWRGYSQRQQWKKSITSYNRIKRAFKKYQMRLRLRLLAERGRQKVLLNQVEWDLGHAGINPSGTKDHEIEAKTSVNIETQSEYEAPDMTETLNDTEFDEVKDVKKDKETKSETKASISMFPITRKTFGALRSTPSSSSSNGHTSMNDSFIKNIQKQIKENRKLSEKLEEEKKKSKNFEDDKRKMAEECKKKDREIKDLKQQISQLTATRDKLRQERDQNSRQFDDVISRLAATEGKIQQRESQNKKLIKKEKEQENLINVLRGKLDYEQARNQELEHQLKVSLIVAHKEHSDFQKDHTDIEDQLNDTCLKLKQWKEAYNRLLEEQKELDFRQQAASVESGRDEERKIMQENNEILLELVNQIEGNVEVVHELRQNISSMRHWDTAIALQESHREKYDYDESKKRSNERCEINASSTREPHSNRLEANIIQSGSRTSSHNQLHRMRLSSLNQHELLDLVPNGRQHSSRSTQHHTRITSSRPSYIDIPLDGNQHDDGGVQQNCYSSSYYDENYGGSSNRSDEPRHSYFSPLLSRPLAASARYYDCYNNFPKKLATVNSGHSGIYSSRIREKRYEKAHEGLRRLPVYLENDNEDILLYSQ